MFGKQEDAKNNMEKKMSAAITSKQTKVIGVIKPLPKTSVVSATSANLYL